MDTMYCHNDGSYTYIECKHTDCEICPINKQCAEAFEYLFIKENARFGD